VINATPVRLLTVRDAQGAIQNWSAASGLVAMGDSFFVVADDENALAVFDAASDAPGWLIPLIDEALPDKKKARKAAKADFESLCWLPQSRSWPHGALLATGSGSKPQRQRAALLALDAQGQPLEPARIVDFAPIFEPLRSDFADLNIEAVFVEGGCVKLLQRANGGSPVNACIGYPLEAFAAWLDGAAAPAPSAITRYELGSSAGVPLGFTDACALPGCGWIFCAAAENTDDSYQDGLVAGAAIGRVGADGRLLSMQGLQTKLKPEGIAIDAASGRIWLVTDADDRKLAASLLAVDAAAMLAGHAKLEAAAR
jgi:hypothetical protein